GIESATALPAAFSAWFAERGWAPRPFQLALIEAAREGAHVLLTAPTGGGKTLAGFLPSLIDLSERGGKSASTAEARAEKRSEGGNPIIAKLKARAAAKPRGVHTLYISPLKALAVD